MITMATDKVMIEKLIRYQQLIEKQLTSNDLVGEYLTNQTLDNVRLLCQMRTIIFLCKTAPWINSNTIALAEKLYSQAELMYFKHDLWIQQLNNSTEATLYSYAFVILAQSYLLKVTQNQLYAIALAETFTLVTNKFQEKTIFKPLGKSACLEQNSAMHLYEALTFACYQAGAIYMKSTIQALEHSIKATFIQPSLGLLAEKVDYEGKVLSYEAGHWFEWVSLLYRMKKWGQPVSIDPLSFYHQAVVNTQFSAQGLVLNEMNVSLLPVNTTPIRIWPNLEYLRAKTFVIGMLPNTELMSFIQLYFDDKGWPIEYLGAANVGVKSTTGYHIAESFIDMLETMKS